ncbi:MAG: hypothetical protein SGILL_001680 [Bacillariaceae sp.]
MNFYVYDDSGYDNRNVRAWLKVANSLEGGSCLTLSARYEATLTPEQKANPTIEQFGFEVANKWISAIKGGVANLTLHASSDARQQLEALKNAHGDESKLEFKLQAEEIFGGVPNDPEQVMMDLASAYAWGGGRYSFLHHNECMLCPRPSFLSATPYFCYQALGVLLSIEQCLQQLLQNHDGADGQDFVCARSVIDASTIFYGLLKMPYPQRKININQSPSPEEAIEFLKQQLSNEGNSWGKMSIYVSTMYCGSILLSCLCMQFLGASLQDRYDYEKWANSFISLADEEFEATEQNKATETGNVFDYRMRIGFLMSELQSAKLPNFIPLPNLRDGPFCADAFFDLSSKVSKMANKWHETCTTDDGTSEYHRSLEEMAFLRLPLVDAHSNIGGYLLQLHKAFDLTTFKMVAARHGFIENEESDCDGNDLIARHYKIAAENCIPDDHQSSLFWYAYGTNIALANESSGYTVGQLREAVRRGDEIQLARNTFLFGEENGDAQSGFEVLATLSAQHFRNKDDTFVLPKVSLNRTGGQLGTPSYKATLSIGEEVFCPNYEQYESKTIRLDKKSGLD